MILKGDCIEVMKAMKPNSVDAICTDPPYGLEFMGKEWDKLRNTWQAKKGRYHNDTTFIAKGDRIRYQAGLEMQLWHTQWLIEAYQVLKPGGSMLVMGGTRTSHRLACAIEDSGFIIKDTLMWIYGSGFPKAQDLGKMIDKRMGKLSTSLSKLQDMLNEKRKQKGLTLKDINKLLGAPENSGLAAHKFCDKSQPQFLTREQMEIIDKELELNGELWELYEEAEREVIGDKIFGDGKTYPQTGKRKCFDQLHPESYSKETIPSTDLAKHWDGFKVGGIKPAYESIIWAVRPPEGSYVDNILKYGVGFVNVDECRIGYKDDKDRAVPFGNTKGKKVYGRTSYLESITEDYGDWKTNHKGRFPANIILSHHSECVQVGVKKVKGSHLDHFCTGGNILNRGAMHKKGKTDPDGYETVESWDCHPDCAVRLLDEQSKKGGIHSAGGKRDAGTAIQKNPQSMFHGKKGSPSNGMRFGDSGGTSRFFYCAKASRAERNAGLEGMEEKECFNLGHKDNPGRNAPKKSYPRANLHPCVKPIKLFEWLIKLVTREGQIILDPFIGSGTTIIAAHNTGRKCIGIEKEGEYLEIAKRRIAHWKSQPKQMEMRI